MGCISKTAAGIPFEPLILSSQKTGTDSAQQNACVTFPKSAELYTRLLRSSPCTQPRRPADILEATYQ